MIKNFYNKLRQNLNSDKIFYNYYDKKYSYNDLKNFFLQFSNVVSYLPNKKNKIFIMSEKSFELYASSLSTILSNNIWIPISMSSPEERVFEIINKVNPDLFIIENISTLKMLRIKNYLKKKKISMVTFKEIYDAKPLINVAIPTIKPNDISMIFFTSGSTGAAKGVQITHKGYISSLMGQINKLYTNQKNLVFGDYHDISFIISLNILFPCFYLGATISPGIDTKDILFPIDHAIKNKVNTLVTVPTTMNRVKNYYKKISAKFKLKILILCGEPFYNDMVQFLVKKNFSQKIFNCYGSTELSPWVFFYKLSKTDFKEIEKFNVVPIGNKFKGVTTKIIDNILYVGGTTLSLGYLDKEQNLDTFKDINKTRYYKTNDIVKKIDDKYFILGRSDSIVKISGYRVELFEIDNRIRKIKSVTNCYVFVEEVDQYEKIIHSCVEGKNLNEIFIKNQLKKNLPNYMMPKRIKIYKKFPLNKNHKIDRVMLKKEFNL